MLPVISTETNNSMFIIVLLHMSMYNTCRVDDAANKRKQDDVVLLQQNKAYPSTQVELQQNEEYFTQIQLQQNEAYSTQVQMQQNEAYSTQVQLKQNVCYAASKNEKQPQYVRECTLELSPSRRKLQSRKL